MLSTPRHPRLQTILIILLALAPMFFVAGVNYIVDPFQIYRKQSWVEPNFWRNQRTQNAGKINSYLAQDGYDSIILGNSVADNFLPSRVAHALGWRKTMKLTVNGGTETEQAFMLKQALEHGTISKVFWCVRVANFFTETPERWHGSQTIPFYLYTKSYLDDFPYLLSMDTFSLSKSFLLKQSLNSERWTNDIEFLNYWQSHKKHYTKQINYSRPENLNDMVQTLSFSSTNIRPVMDSKFLSLENNLLGHVRRNPDVDFVILIAPRTTQSLLTFSINELNKYLEFHRHLVKSTSNLPNIKIFGFQDISKIVDNLANFRDPIHYHSGVNEFMLRAIAHGDNRLTSINIDTYITKIIDKLHHFKVHSDFKTMIPLALPEENEALRRTLASISALDHLKQAKELFNDKKYDQAITFTSKVIEIANLDRDFLAKAHAFRAKTHLRSNHPELAIPDFDRALELRPDKVMLFLERGQARLGLKDFEGAKIDFQRFVNLQPDNFRGYWYLGNIMAKTGKRKEALTLLSKAISLEPKLSALYRDRGMIFEMIGNMPAAGDDFRRAEMQGLNVAF